MRPKAEQRSATPDSQGNALAEAEQRSATPDFHERGSAGSVLRSPVMDSPVRVLIAHYSTNYELWNFPADALSALQTRFPKVQFHRCASSEDYRQHLPAATAVFGSWLPPEDLPLAGKLRWFHTSWAGIEKQLYPAFLASGIRLTTSGVARAPFMAEAVLGALIAFNRQFPRMWAAQQQQEWIAPALWEDYRQLVTLDGRRMVIAGLGGIGQEVARLAKAFGMEVWGTRRDVTQDVPWVDRLEPPDKLPDLLDGTAIAVINALPATAETRSLFGAALFGRMGPAAVFVNVGRGATVIEPELVAALEGHVIRGAILDVFATEPLPPESPLWTAPGCMILPHATNIVDRYWEPTIGLFAENLGRFLGGLPLLNEVVQAGQGAEPAAT